MTNQSQKTLTPLENALISLRKEEMITFLKNNPEHFEEAISLAIVNTQPFSWRSAWLIWSCISENDPRVHPKIDAIINALPSLASGHQRELLKILMAMKINNDQEGQILKICFELWESIGLKPGVRYIAMKFILQIAKKYPELKHEIQLVSQEHYLESLSPGVHRSIQKMLSAYLEK